MNNIDKFCLKWNDFKENVRTDFVALREDTDFKDVTLSSQDKQQIAAHKVILSASSPLFREMLQQSKHSHPIIYMKGIRSKDLISIIDFIYHGEVNIYQEDLSGFLAIAEELILKLRGLTEGMTGDTMKTDNPEILDCGLMSEKGNKTYEHIESIHIEAGSHNCNICGKTCKSWKSLRMHVYVSHKNLKIRY